MTKYIKLENLCPDFKALSYLFKGEKEDFIRVMQTYGFDNWLAFILQRRSFGFVAKKIIDNGWESIVPARFLSEINSWRFQNAAANDRLIKEWDLLSETLSKANIPHASIKGCHFLKAIYSDDISLRSMGDMDILVHPEDVKTTISAIKKIGYSTLTDNALILAEYPWVLEIEVSSHVIPRGHFNFPVDLVWKRAKCFEGTQFAISESDHFILIALHNFKHNILHHVSGLYDMHTMITKKAVDLNDIRNIAIEFGLERALYASISVVKIVFNTDIPEDLITSLEPKGIRRGITNWYLTRMSYSQTKRPFSGSAFIFHLSSFTRIKDIFPYIASRIFGKAYAKWEGKELRKRWAKT